MPGIAGASGTLCKTKYGARIIITTRKAPTTNPNKVRMYFRPANSYQRKTPVSQHEMQVRSLFTRRQALVSELMRTQHLSKAEAWKIAKHEITE